MRIDPIIIKILGDASHYLKQLQTAIGATRGLGGAFNQVADSIGSAIGAATAFAAVVKSIQLSAEVEKTTAAFGVMLRNMAAGVEMVEDLRRFAAETPLNAPEIQKAAKTLLQFGIAGHQIIPTLKQIGDVTGADADRFLRMSLAFGQVVAAGRLKGQELLQMVNAGFNPLQEIAERTGETMSQLREKMKDGAITVEMVKNAFASATGPTGTFHNLMEKMSKTLGGRFSTLKDEVQKVMTTFGDLIAKGGQLTSFIESVTKKVQEADKAMMDWAPQIKLVAAVVVPLLGVFLALKAATLAVSAAVFVITGIFSGLTTILGAVLTATTGVIAPLALLAIGIFLVTKAAIEGGKYLTGYSKAAEDMAKAVARSTEISKKQLMDFNKETKKMKIELDKFNKLDISKEEQTAGKKRFATAELEKAEKAVENYRNQVERARKSFDELNTITNQARAPEIIAAAKTELQNANNQLDAAKSRVDILKGALDKIAQAEKLNPQTNPENIAAAKALTQELEKQIITFGLTGAEADIAKAKLQGLTDAQLANARGLAQMLKKLEEQKKLKEEAAAKEKQLQESIKSTTDSLKDQIAALQAGEKDTTLFRLAREGASQADLDNIKSLMQQKKAAEAHQKIMEDGKKITEDVMTNAEKYQANITLLKESLAKGAITEETYNRALQKTTDEYNKAEQGAKNAAQAVGKFDQALSGSAEAFTRLQQQKDANTKFRDMAKSAMPVAPPKPKTLSDIGVGANMNQWVKPTVPSTVKPKTLSDIGIGASMTQWAKGAPAAATGMPKTLSDIGIGTPFRDLGKAKFTGPEAMSYLGKAKPIVGPEINKQMTLDKKEMNNREMKDERTEMLALLSRIAEAVEKQNNQAINGGVKLSFANFGSS